MCIRGANERDRLQRKYGTGTQNHIPVWTHLITLPGWYNDVIIRILFWMPSATSEAGNHVTLPVAAHESEPT